MPYKQVYIPYHKWEDFINGMWRSVDKDQEQIMLQQAVEFTGDHIRYGSAMKEVSLAWPETMLNSLTNPSINRRAFLGHCAVQYKIGIPEYITRMAWKQLTDKQRESADKVAQQTINEWSRELRTTLNYGRKDVTQKASPMYHQLRLQI